MIELYDYQLDAIRRIKNGSILCGGVGSGKSLTSLTYYFFLNGGDIIDGDEYYPMDDPPMDLYIITTARKRDDMEWEGELNNFLMSTNPENSIYQHKVVVDSWNNIGKYINVRNSFFIFDEQRVVGKGAWVKSFLKIVKANQWILLSATPGDTWSDYIPVFIANGFYKNRTQFNNEHVIFERFSKYPKVKGYWNTGRLIRYRNDILVTMNFDRQTVSHFEDVWTNYDKEKYKHLMKTRWNYEKDKPIETASELYYLLRKITNTDESRQTKLLEIFEKHPKIIVFYNFDYELDILKSLYYGENVTVAEWNGHKHEPVPDTESWVYLVNYSAGAEGWNCTKTDTIVFYSQNYSYKILIQSRGRIDRLNTPYKDLYYYHMKSRADVDMRISRALKLKKNFNETPI